MRRVSIDLLILVAFALAAFVFYWPALVGGKVLLPLDNLWTMPPWSGPPGAVPHNHLISDMILQNYPWKLILEQALHQHELPLWNPYEMVGLPYLATGQTSVLYPFTALFLILGPLQAFGWYCALHQFLAASLTYLLLRRLGAGRFGAAIGGLTFAFCFFLTVSYIWPMVLGSAVWLPLALWSLAGLAQAIQKQSLARAIAVDLPIGVLAIALGVLGGHLEIAFYATFVAALYAAYLAARFFFRRQREECGRMLLAAVLVIGLGVLLSAVQLVPFLQVLRSNNRQGETTYQQVISYALPKHQILGFLMPDFFGNPTTHSYFDLTTFRETPVGTNAHGQPTDPPHTIHWGTKNYVEAGGYVGVVGLLLALIGALRSRHRDRWFFAGLAVLSLLLAFGTPLYALIYYGLPFFSQLRTPFRWLYPFDFSMAALAGLGAEALWRMGEVVRPSGKDSMRVRDLLASSSLLLAPAIGLVGLATLALSLVERKHSVALAARILARRADLQQAFGSGAVLYSYEFRNLAIFFCLLAVGGILVALLAWSKRGERIPRGSDLSGPLLNLEQGRSLSFRTAVRNLWTRIAAPRDSSLAALGMTGTEPTARPNRRNAGRSETPAQVRPILAALIILLLVGDLFYFGTRFVSEEPAAILSQHVDLSAALKPDLAGPRYASLGDPEVLPPNLGVILGVPAIAGYDTIIPARFVDLWSLVEPPGDLPYNKIGLLHHQSSLASPILDLLDVKYVLSASPVNSPAVKLVGTYGTVRVYERPTALPRAFVVGQARWVGSVDAAIAAMKAPGFRPDQEVVLESPDSSGGAQSAEAGAEGHGTATITSYQFDRVVVEADVTGPAWLVLADGYAPGWQATVDGAAVTVQIADADLRAVQLTAGKHQIVFRYSPLALRVGAYISCLALLVLALIASWPLWRRLIGHYAGQAERVLRNTALPMFTSFLNKAVDFGFAALMLRILGPKNVGEYTVAIILMGYFEIFTNFGLNALIVREVARDRQVAGRYLANAIALRLGLCAIAAPVAAALVLLAHAWLGLADQGIVAFVLLALALVPGNLSAALTALFNAWERIEVPAAVSVAINLARVSLSVAALLMGAGIIGLAAIALALNIVIVIVFVILARRILVLKLTGPVPADLPAMLNESLPLLANHVLVTVFFKMDVLLLQAFKGSEVVGYYATAYKWIDGVLIVPSTFTFAVFPVLSRYAQQTRDGLRSAYEISARILLTLAMPIAVVIAALAGDLVLLLGGPAYYPVAANALMILICFLPFSYLNGLTQYALIAVDRQRFITVAFVISATFNIVANLIFIPRYSLYAASVITVASEIVLLIPFLFAIRQSIGPIDWRKTAGKPALAGLLMAAVAWAGRPIDPYLALLAGALVYLGAAWALRIFSAEEIGVLRGMLGAMRKGNAHHRGTEKAQSPQSI